MLGVTSTTNSLSANADHPLPSTTYLCNSCQISFQDGQKQRLHMKEPWHVNNVKRRIASLPPVPLTEFETEAERKAKKKSARKDDLRAESAGGRGSSTSSSTDQVPDDEDERSASPFRCLFCNQSYPDDDAGFATNLEHMHTAHGMAIPDPEMVLDMQSLIGYLATEVRAWHECLYCGATKPSTPSIQSHMRDKGHCLLNFDREPELLDFWESPDDDDDDDDDDDAATPEQGAPIAMSPTEMHLASGRVVGARHAAATTTTTQSASRKRSPTARTTKALPAHSEGAAAPPPGSGPQLATGRQIARREAMGLQGISVQQRSALVLAEKKAQRSEAVARRAREWAYAKGANLQKYDQIDGKMKMGKQNHKLQPR